MKTCDKLSWENWGSLPRSLPVDEFMANSQRIVIMLTISEGWLFIYFKYNDSKILILMSDYRHKKLSNSNELVRVVR